MLTTEYPKTLPMIGLDGIVLKASSHHTREAGVCSMEAVAWLAGEPHSDRPACACPVIGAFMIAWNDALPDDETRTRLLKPLLPLLVGSRAAARDAVWAAAGDAARDALRPTVEQLQISAADLVRRMVAVK